MQTSALKALLFDLGGVLVNIDFSRALMAWSSLSTLPADELRRAFRFDHAYERHERGEIAAHEYFSYLTSTLQLCATPQQVEAGWNAIFIGEIAETRMLVEAARQKLPCYAFTNTNASHMKTWSALFPRVVSAFDRVFASHQMGLRKPERAAFDYICRTLALSPESILFFDDLAENVRAAQEAGLLGVLVRTPQDVATALRLAVGT
jgi:epoxide hydrolase-like predicted phosphatase